MFTHGKYYYASGVCLISLPYSTYGLDVLAYIGWQHEHEHKQMGEIQSELNGRGCWLIIGMWEALPAVFWRYWGRCKNRRSVNLSRRSGSTGE